MSRFCKSQSHRVHRQAEEPTGSRASEATSASDKRARGAAQSEVGPLLGQTQCCPSWCSLQALIASLLGEGPNRERLDASVDAKGRTAVQGSSSTS